MKKKRLIGKIIYHVLVCGLGLVMIYPLVWMIMSSFKPTSTIFTTAGQLITICIRKLCKRMERLRKDHICDIFQEFPVYFDRSYNGNPDLLFPGCVWSFQM